MKLGDEAVLVILALLRRPTERTEDIDAPKHVTGDSTEPTAGRLTSGARRACSQGIAERRESKFNHITYHCILRTKDKIFNIDRIQRENLC